MVNIASWSNTRLDRWRTLLKARAIENQSFAIVVNRPGADCNDLLHDPSSIAYCPNGESLLLDFSELDPELSIVDLRLSDVCAVCCGFPSLKYRRANLY